MTKSCIDVKRRLWGVALFAAAGVLAMPSLASAQEAASKDEVFSLSTTIKIDTTALVSFDISWVDTTLGQYFLADRSHKSIDVIDTASNTVSTLIIPTGSNAFAGVVPTPPNVLSGPNGVLTLQNTGGREIWTGDGPTVPPLVNGQSICATNAFNPTASPQVPLNGKCSTVKVFPASATGGAAPSHIISTNGAFRADELCHDPRDHLILMANDADTPTFISFISTDTYAIVSQLAIPEATNGIEQCQWDADTAMFYLNIPEVNGPGDDSADGSVYVISPKTMTIVKKYDVPVAKCAGPQGMAIGPNNQILLGCNAGGPPATTGPQNMAILNKRSGTIIAVLDGLGGADQVSFNPSDGHYFGALGSHLPDELLAVIDAKSHLADQTVFVGNAGGTTRRAHSVAADPNTNQVYLPVPATGGGSPGFTSTLCGTDAVTGCIAVFTTTGNNNNQQLVRRGHQN